MRIARYTAYIIGAMTLALLPLALPARAATTAWYARSDSIPSAQLTSSAPPHVELPNYDPGRDADPGLLLMRTGEGANETTPSKYQQWARDVSGTTLSVQSFHIWAAPKDFAMDKTVELRAYLMACGNGCDVLDSAAATLRPSSEWRMVSFPLTANNVTFEEGSVLVVKVVAHSSSETDAWLAYGTAAYDARLKLIAEATPATTPTSTQPSTTSTKAEAADTSTTSPSPTTSAASTASTTTTTSTTSTTSTIPTSRTTPPSPNRTGEPGPAEEMGPLTSEGPATGHESTPLEPALFVAASGSAATLSDDPIDIFKQTVRELEPAEGLAVVFATMTENITLYWQAAIGTGSVASILLWLGLSRRESDE